MPCTALYARNSGERTVRLTLARAGTVAAVFVGAVAIVLVIQLNESLTASLGSVSASTTEPSTGADASAPPAGDGAGVHMFPDDATPPPGLDDKAMSDTIRRLEIQALLLDENVEKHWSRPRLGPPRR